MLYDISVGGMVSSALVPVFSEYISSERRDELWRISSLIFCLTILSLSLVAIVLEVAAPVVARLMVVGFEEELLKETTRLLRIAAPAVVFMSLSGVIGGLLYTLKRFFYPAFTTAVLNAGIVLVAIIARGIGVSSLALGLLMGAALQVALQLPGLKGMRFSPSINLSHPGLRRILSLYLPIVLGLLVSQVGIAIDRNLASRTGPRSIARMRFATSLIQFPLGLISVAVSTAILPLLSQQLSTSQFRATLASGLRLVLFLILPAAVGLFVLSTPLVELLFEHGFFEAEDTTQTALALRCYLLGLVFAAVDLPLVFAFYARKDTITPAFVGVLGVGFYLAVALALIRPLGMIGLVLANSAQLTCHALAMIFLIRRRIGGLSGGGIASTALKSLFASMIMGGVAYLSLAWIRKSVDTSSLAGELALVAGAGSVGLFVYLGMAAILRLEEVKLIEDMTWKVIAKLMPLTGKGKGI
jgi:putative peptidoglycan lipid II flippase